MDNCFIESFNARLRDECFNANVFLSPADARRKMTYGGFTYTKESHEAKVGSLVLSITDKETVNVPIWVGVGAIVVGGLLLV